MDRSSRRAQKKGLPARSATLAFPLRTSPPGLGAPSAVNARRRPVTGSTRPASRVSPVDSLWITLGRTARHRCRSGGQVASWRPWLWTAHDASAAYGPLTSDDVATARPPGVERRKFEEMAGTDGSYEGGPVAALRRIAFLMERGREETRRIQAFRNAAAVILPLPADEVAARVAAGTLTELAGIGPSTASVITDAVERRDAGAAREARGGLRAAGQGRRRGAREAQGRPPLPLRLVRRRVADRGDGLHRHRAGPRLPRAHRPLAAADRRQRAERRAADPPARRRRGDQRPPRRQTTDGDFTLLKGIEVDILDDGGLDQTDEMLARLDLRVASVHSKLRMDAAPMTKRMIGAIKNPRMNVLGHCTGRMVMGNRGTRPPSSFDAEGGLRGMRRARRRRRDQLASRAPRPADQAARARARHRLPVLDRQRRARAGSARLPAVRLRARARRRHRPRPHRQHLAARSAAGVGQPASVRWTR